MRILLTTLLVGIALVGSTAGEAEPVPMKETCKSLHKGITFYRNAVWKIQDDLSLRPTKASKAPIRSCKYARWVADLWRTRLAIWQEVLHSLEDPVVAIRFVFREYSDQALRVAACESGHAYSVNAHNGQYLGMFQMGDFARSTYGHGSTPLAQARAAHRYFVASGRDWSPWSCKP